MNSFLDNYIEDLQWKYFCSFQCVCNFVILLKLTWFQFIYLKLKMLSISALNVILEQSDLSEYIICVCITVSVSFGDYALHDSFTSVTN